MGAHILSSGSSQRKLLAYCYASTKLHERVNRKRDRQTERPTDCETVEQTNVCANLQQRAYCWVDRELESKQNAMLLEV